jgi:hypothetical protein
MQSGSSGIVYGGLKYQASKLLRRRLLEPSVTACPVLISGHSYLQARCIADVRAEAGSTTFLAGTLSLREENEVRFSGSSSCVGNSGVRLPLPCSDSDSGNSEWRET